jgi:ATP-dependent protease ClpP protease subunit
MIHYGEETHSDHPKIVRRWVKEYEKNEEMIKSMFLEKTKEKNPNIRRSDIDKLLNFDTIYNPLEAVEMGLADGILEPAKGHKVT